MHTGDLAVEHPDGYVEIKDRAKDIIISGGENISSVEVEIALYKHPAVQLAAVVARPDQKWGETPCAFVQLKPGGKATAEEIIALLPRPAGAFQGAEVGGVRSAADHRHRQDPEVRAARARPPDPVAGHRQPVAGGRGPQKAIRPAPAPSPSALPADCRRAGCRRHASARCRARSPGRARCRPRPGCGRRRAAGTA